MLYTMKHFQKGISTDTLFASNVATFPNRLIKNRFRLGARANRILDLINFQMLDLIPLPDHKKIIDFSPDIVLVCPNSISDLIVGCRIAKALRLPFIIYFMDDWPALHNLRWVSGSTDSYTKWALRNAAGWMMISEQLASQFKQRSGHTNDKLLVAHNPVDCSKLGQPEFNPRQQPEFRIAYAGAIWPMHLDAVQNVASAVSMLRNTGTPIRLILHIPENHWREYRDFFERHGVENGNLVPYEDLHGTLQLYDLLLVASSFKEEFAPITRGSVQTKLTDYMATGRPIVVHGPEYSACVDFVRRWKCGFVISHSDVEIVKKQIVQVMDESKQNDTFARNAHEVLLRNFDKNIVVPKVFEFITQTAIANQ